MNFSLPNLLPNIPNLIPNLIVMLFTIPALLIAFPVHEFSHGITAYALGDKTAKNMGRLTLNPIKHLDVLGTICIIFLHFGWAKPVPVNPNNFKNPKAGMSLTALAGPVSNFILAFLSLFLEGLYIIAMGNKVASGVLYVISYIIVNFLYTSAFINISLGIFNLIPIPPLDGQKIIGFLLPDSLQNFFDRNGMYFQVLLMILLFTSLLTAPLSNMVYAVNNCFSLAINTIFHMFGVSGAVL